MDTPPETNAERERREGRGRLSTIEMLPEECDEDIAWLQAELDERKMPQTEILKQFNARLADRGIKGISKGAFSRYTVRKAIMLRKQAASRDALGTVFSRFDPTEATETMIAATEMAKYHIAELFMAGDADPGLLNKATLSLARISTIVAREKQLKRQELKDKQEADKLAADQAARERADAEAAARIDRAGQEAGLTADSIAAIRRGVLGIGG